MQVLKFQGKNQVTIPKEVIEQFSLERGDILKCEVDGSHIVLTPVDLELSISQKHTFRNR
ncbi:AbrB/MazE/SpoVT family DNA-binding domain-containing protein [bacterium]|nr:AbrB/MazE/SpoVT family DNA-binding domain-containing protein [bacterium]MBU1615142.1 AbrB/MazE/SpoVT family DNA-binding domain-containing protein [bacterium]